MVFRRAVAFWTIIAGCSLLSPVGAQPLRISYSGVAGQNLAIWVTYEAGLFKKYGLNPEMLMIAGGVTNLQALMAGEIAFVYQGGASPIQAISQNADLTILATAYGLMPYGIVTGKGIQTTADLKGKRVAVSRVGGIEETAIRFALDKLGVGARNVTFIQTGADPVRIAAVESGAASAAALAPPGLFGATARGLNLLTDLGTLNIRYPASVISARKTALTSERPLAKRFLMALVEGLHVYHQNKSLAIKALQKYTQQNNAEILSKSYDYFVKNTPLVPLSDVVTFENALPTDKPSERKPQSFYDNSILEELVQEGFVKKIGR
jgi:ABC-type nitrate/sulfonate/bicarbonate transport system substrate-binding protein